MLWTHTGDLELGPGNLRRSVTLCCAVHCAQCTMHKVKRVVFRVHSSWCTVFIVQSIVKFVQCLVLIVECVLGTTLCPWPLPCTTVSCRAAINYGPVITWRHLWGHTLQLSVALCSAVQCTAYCVNWSQNGFLAVIVFYHRIRRFC